VLTIALPAQVQPVAQLVRTEQVCLEEPAFQAVQQDNTMPKLYVLHALKDVLAAQQITLANHAQLTTFKLDHHVSNHAQLALSRVVTTAPTVSIHANHALV